MKGDVIHLHNKERVCECEPCHQSSNYIEINIKPNECNDVRTKNELSICIWKWLCTTRRFFKWYQFTNIKMYAKKITDFVYQQPWWSIVKSYHTGTPSRRNALHCTNAFAFVRSFVCSKDIRLKRNKKKWCYKVPCAQKVNERKNGVQTIHKGFHWVSFRYECVNSKRTIQ